MRRETKFMSHSPDLHGPCSTYEKMAVWSVVFDGFACRATILWAVHGRFGGIWHITLRLLHVRDAR